jgi:hypothetical protein
MKEDKIIEKIKWILRKNSDVPIKYKNYKIYYDISCYLNNILQHGLIDDYNFTVDKNYSINLSYKFIAMAKKTIIIKDIVFERKSKLNSIKF